MTLPGYLAFGLSGILGMFFVSIIATIFNFFLPLYPEIIFLILCGGLIFAYTFRSLNITYLSLSDKIAIFACSIIVFILIPFIWKNFYDTGLYHIAAMRWTLESPLTYGLANLHGRLGFNSLWTPLISIIDGFAIILNDPLFLLNGIMTVFFCSIVVMRSIRLYKEHKSFQFSDVFLLFSLIPIFLYGTNFINSASPDYAIIILTLFILYLYLYAYENQKYLKNIFILAFLLSVFALTIKISAIILCICTVGSLIFIVFRRHHFFLFKNSITPFVEDITKIIKTHYTPLLLMFLILLIWLTRGIILSGYAIYPFPWTGIHHLPWTVPLSLAQGEQEAVIGWARNPGPDHLSSLHDWTWVPKWFANSGKHLFIPIITLLVSVAILLVYKFHFKLSFIKKGPFLHILFISIIGVIFWFLTAPDPRFGYGVIFGLSLGFLAWGGFQYISKDIPFKFNIRQLLLVYSVLLIIGGATVYYVSTQHNEPTKLEFPHPEVDIKYTYEGYSIYTPKDGDQLWNSPLPNTPYFQKNISFRYQEGGTLPRWIFPA